MMTRAWMFGVALTTACSGVEPTADDAASWTVDHTTADGVLQGVWGSAPNDVWVVGGQTDRSVVLHGDGTAWRTVDVPSTSLLHTIYGFSGADIYAVGERGVLLHYDGTTWTQIPSGTDATLFGVWGASGDDVWVVGADMGGSPIVLRGARESFDVVALPDNMASDAVYKAHGFAADDVMLAGTGTVLHWNGAEWRRDSVPTTAPLFSMWGRGADDVYAVGGSSQAEILHFDGQLWSRVASVPITQGLKGVFTSTDGPTIAVGPQSYVFELDRNGSLSQAELPELAPAPQLHGVWGDGHGTTYVVGGSLYSYPQTDGVILTRR